MTPLFLVKDIYNQLNILIKNDLKCKYKCRTYKCRVKGGFMTVLGKNQRTKLQTIVDRCIIYQLALEGYSSYKMAQEPELCHLSPRTIQRDLIKEKKKRKKEQEDKINDIKSFQIDRHEDQIMKLSKDLILSREGLTKDQWSCLSILVESGDITTKGYEYLKSNLKAPGNALLYKEIREHLKELNKIYDIYPAEKKKLEIENSPSEAIQALSDEELVKELAALEDIDN